MELAGWRYVGPILPVTLVDLLAGKRPAGSGSGGSNGGGDGVSESKTSKVDTYGEGARVRVCYNAHLTTLSLQYRENSRTILAGSVLPNLHVQIICKNLHL